MKTHIIAFFTFIFLPAVLFGQVSEDVLRKISENKDKKETIRIIQQVDVLNPNYEELNKLFKLLDKSVRKSTEGKYFERYLEALKDTQPGKKAPGITQFDIAGQPYSLQDLRGKYVLVSFWASWNANSRAQIPFYKEIYGKYKAKNFEILAVSFDNDFKSWKKYVEENDLTWKHISDLQNMNNGAALFYGIKGIPQNVLVDPEGVVIARNIYGAELEAKLAELMP